ncbi:MAG: hypothetical protein WKF57_10550 [Nakamurella sp.]
MNLTDLLVLAEELLSEHDGTPQPVGRESRTTPMERLSAALHQQLSEITEQEDQ